MEPGTIALESPQNKSDSLLGLYLAAFLFATHDHATLTALPWRIMGLGGQTLAVGAIGALYLGAYTISCLCLGARLGRLGPKRQVLFSAAGTLLLVLAMPLVPHVGLLLTLVTVKGMIMCCFWPPLMGWVSAGTEGAPLNRRLGLFNFSWCSGAIVGSWMGGTLFAVQPWLPFVVAGLTIVLTIFFAATVREKSLATKPSLSSLPDEPEPANLVLFRWIARIGLFSGWIASAALRVPIASLIKQMSLGSGLHATVAAGINFTMMVCFFLLGRSRIWHYRFSVVIASQFLLAAALIGIGKCASAHQLIFFTIAATPALAFAYSSHLFYCFSSTGNRQKNASLHEILLAVGFSVGSLGGGAFGQLYGIRWIYFAIAAIALAALLTQTAVRLLLKSPPKAPQTA
jgi:MFS family permease